MNPALKRIRENTIDVRLLTGETGQVVEMSPGEWYVTMDGDVTTLVRHDPARGRTTCECGQPFGCNHRTAVWRVMNGRPIAEILPREHRGSRA